MMRRSKDPGEKSELETKDTKGLNEDLKDTVMIEENSRTTPGNRTREMGQQTLHDISSVKNTSCDQRLKTNQSAVHHHGGRQRFNSTIMRASHPSQLAHGADKDLAVERESTLYMTNSAGGHTPEPGESSRICSPTDLYRKLAKQSR